jgi:acetyl-CoA acyltransferase
VDLARACVRELVERSEADPAWIDTVVMGQVIPSVAAPNLAREVVLGTGLPVSIPAHTVNRACASAGEAIAEVVDEIRDGLASVGIAGGAESLSDVPILHSRRMAQALVEASKARGVGAKLKAFAHLRPRDLTPQTPAIAEPSTGLTMGQSAEKMAKETASRGRSRTGSPTSATATPPRRWTTAAWAPRRARCCCRRPTTPWSPRTT